MASYRNGAIRWVSMENWMAYSGPVTLYASPGVNIIAAANGCGKSAIVCAIALGLGFEISVLNRGDNIRAFVKRGCMRALLKVALVDDEAPDALAIVERDIILTDAPKVASGGITSTSTGTSRASSSNPTTAKRSKFTTLVKNVWSINGKAVTLDVIKRLHAKLNVKVNNYLCFLAQANVGKFAAMTPLELFKSTISAINETLADELQQLIEKSNALTEKRSQVKTLTAEINMCNTKIAQLKSIDESLTNHKHATLRMNLVKLHLLKIKMANIVRGIEATTNRISSTMQEHWELEVRFKKYDTRFRSLKRETSILLSKAEKKIDAAKHQNVSLGSLDGTSTSQNNLDKCYFDCLTQIKTFAHSFKNQGRDDETSASTEPKMTPNMLNEKLTRLNSEITVIKAQMVNTSDLVDAIAELEFQQIQIRAKLERLLSNAGIGTFDPMRLQIEALLNLIPSIKRNRYRDYIYNNYGSKLDFRNEELACTLIGADIRVRGHLYSCIIEDAIGKYLECFVIDSNAEGANKILDQMLNDYKLPTVTVPKRQHVLVEVTQPMEQFGVIAFLHELLDESKPKTVQVLASVVHLNECFIVDEGTFYSNAPAQQGKELEAHFERFYLVMLHEIGTQLGKRITTLKYYMGNKRHIYRQFKHDAKHYTDTQSELPANTKVLYNFQQQDPTDSRLQGNAEVTDLKVKLDHIVQESSRLKKLLKERNKDNVQVNRHLYALSREQVLLEEQLRTIGNEVEVMSASISSRRDWKREFEELKEKHKADMAQAILYRADAIGYCLGKLSESRKFLCEARELSDVYNVKNEELEHVTPLYEEAKTAYKESRRQLEILQNTKKQQMEILNTRKEEINELQIAVRSISEYLSKQQSWHAQHLVNKSATSTSASSSDSSSAGNSENVNVSASKTPLLILQEAGKGLENKSEGELETELSVATALVIELEMDDHEHAQNAKNLQQQLLKLGHLESNLEAVNGAIATLNQEYTSMYHNWYGCIAALVERVDANFSRCMQYIGKGSNGQVRLEAPIDSIKGTCLKVMVKYSEQRELVPLSASYQSGGERGVATMAFILAVQDLTRNGFFVIDEINQGLDCNYEKKLVDLLLGNANFAAQVKQEGVAHRVAQYFILTPQLLPGMNLKGATLHFVLNGPGVVNGLVLQPNSAQVLDAKIKPQTHGDSDEEEDGEEE